MPSKRFRDQRKSAPGAGQLFHAVGAIVFYRDPSTNEPHILTANRNASFQGRWPNRVQFGWAGVKKVIATPRRSKPVLESDALALSREGIEEFSRKLKDGRVEPLINLEDEKNVKVTPIASVLPVAEFVTSSGILKESSKPRMTADERLIRAVLEGKRASKLEHAVDLARTPHGLNLSTPELKRLLSAAKNRRLGREYRLTLHLVELTPAYAQQLAQKLGGMKKRKEQLGNNELHNAKFEQLWSLEMKKRVTPKLFQPHLAPIVPEMRKMIERTPGFSPRKR